MANAGAQIQLVDLHNILNDFITNRQKLVRFLYETADKLDKHHKNVKITKVVTDGTGIAGTIVSLSGLLFAVPTGGLSLTLTVGGGILAATSGVVHLGSGVVEHLLNESSLKRLDKLSRADEANYLRLNDYLARYVENLRNNASDNNIFAEAGFDIIKEISSLASLGCSIIRVTLVASTAASSIRVFSAASAVLGAIALPFQIIDLTNDGRALHASERSEMANEFRQLAQNLTVQVNNVGQYVIAVAN